MRGKPRPSGPMREFFQNVWFAFFGSARPTTPKLTRVLAANGSVTAVADGDVYAHRDPVVDVWFWSSETTEPIPVWVQELLVRGALRVDDASVTLSDAGKSFAAACRSDGPVIVRNRSDGSSVVLGSVAFHQAFAKISRRVEQGDISTLDSTI